MESGWSLGFHRQHQVSTTIFSCVCFPKCSPKAQFYSGDLGLGHRFVSTFLTLVELPSSKTVFCLFVCFCLFRASLEAYGGSQARGQIGAAAASLHHSHSNLGSECI